MFERNIPLRLQNVEKYCVYKMLQSVGLRNYQRGGYLKKGEVTFERGGSDPLGNYDAWKQKNLCVETIQYLHRWLKTKDPLFGDENCPRISDFPLLVWTNMKTRDSFAPALTLRKIYMLCRSNITLLSRYEPIGLNPHFMHCYHWRMQSSYEYWYTSIFFPFLMNPRRQTC